MEGVYRMDTVYDPDTGENMLIKTLDVRGERASNNVYLDEQTFTNYLDVLLHHKDNNICTITSSIVLEYFVTLDLFKLNYQIPETMYGFINLCKMRPIQPEFYIIPLKVQYDINTAHSNVIIVNKKQNVIEYFEPHGLMMNMGGIGYDVSKMVQQIVNHLFPLQELPVKNVSSQCPVGPQSVQSLANPNSGHCLAWSLLFINMRILNLHLKPELIVTYLSFLSPYDLDLLIRRYMSKLETELMFFPMKQYDKSRTFGLLFSEDDKIRISQRIAYLAKSLMLENNGDNRENLKELLLYNNFPSFYEIFFENVNKRGST